MSASQPFFIADLILCFSGASRKDQPSFTLRQVSYLCERLLKDHEEKIREEYEQILNTKLAGNNHSLFKKYHHSQFIWTARTVKVPLCDEKHPAPAFMSIFSHHNSAGNSWFPLTELVYASRWERTFLMAALVQ